MFNFTSTDLLMGAITVAGAVAIAIYKLRSNPGPKMYAPSATCEFCSKKKLVIDGTCSQVKRVEGCNIAPDHRHVSCDNCKAAYIQRNFRWYD